MDSIKKTIGSNRVGNWVMAGLVAGLAVPIASAQPVEASWTDYYPTEGQLWYEQPLSETLTHGIWSNRLSNDLPVQVMDDFEIAHDAMIDEVVFYGWAFDRDRNRWALLSENIAGFTVEIWKNEPDATDHGCAFEPGELVVSKSVWRSQAEGPFTGVTAIDGGLVQRLSIGLDQAVQLHAGARSAIRITATVADSPVPLGFKWAEADGNRYAHAYDSAALPCSPSTIHGGSPVYGRGVAFELAGPGFGDIVHRQLADHQTGFHVSTMNLAWDERRVFDDFVSAFDGKLDAVTFYGSCADTETGVSIEPYHAMEDIHVNVYEMIDSNGQMVPREEIGRAVIPRDEFNAQFAFEQWEGEGDGLHREWYTFTAEMQPPIALERGKRYALSIAGTMVDPEGPVAFSLAETFESSTQDNGYSAVSLDRDPGPSLLLPLDTSFAFSVHGLSTPWCGVADMAEPFGQLDLADISAFATAFLAHEDEAELTGDGIRDLQDITRFIESFLAGCPSIE